MKNPWFAIPALLLWIGAVLLAYAYWHLPVVVVIALAILGGWVIGDLEEMSVK